MTDRNISKRSTLDKALRINLDNKKYGTIVEIGAGQEVARQFFKTGAAAGTIAKTMSAYDMKFSDAIYGVQEDGRYVSRARVQAMLDKEFDLVIDRVGTSRSIASRYFSYAATVAAKSFKVNNECHAWCGIRVQMYPAAEPSDIVVHVRMRDENAERQQLALGTFGVNLIYAAYYYFGKCKKDHRFIDRQSRTGPYRNRFDRILRSLFRRGRQPCHQLAPDSQLEDPRNYVQTGRLGCYTR